ncbi:hypothetical protein ALQ65_00728 [Pseudomonas syringae pv. coriandricola]|uniref:Retropepsin-like aspartic endopeptidase domain-containing protein n=3 Tax=Pseudomonas syringae group TaxID=136849 RepID=A0A0P9N1Q6_9PSED|nr:Uncharacterized protein ALO76_02786 [Pseudomonas syringae pv. coriandricola]RMN07875.1 hypothetical protein ALQ65_00728 [Pseudomonas syringae pv. coriandricola]
MLDCATRPHSAIRVGARVCELPASRLSGPSRSRPDSQGFLLIAPGFMRLTTLTACFCLLFLPAVTLAASKTVYGLNEYARLIDIDVEVPAKLDTGAKTASLSARDIKPFKRNGERWVRFYLAIDSKHIHPIERPLARVSKIKRRADDLDPDDKNTHSSRPVISLAVCMGEVLRTIEVNLTDRSAFQYPLLIGSEALKRFDALVDPSLKYAAGKPGCASVALNAE